MSPLSSSSSTINDSNDLDISELVLSIPSDITVNPSPQKSKSRCYRYPWTREEDYLLIQCVQKFGEKNWKIISENIPGRTGKQCRQRWFYNLSPDVQKRKWTEEEDIILMSTQQEIGNKWTLIRKKLPGRSENDVKNRYHSIMNRMKTRHKKEEKRLLKSNSPNPVIFPSSVIYPLCEQSAIHSSIIQNTSVPSSNDVCNDMTWGTELTTSYSIDDLIHLS